MALLNKNSVKLPTSETLGRRRYIRASNGNYTTLNSAAGDNNSKNVKFHTLGPKSSTTNNHQNKRLSLRNELPQHQQENPAKVVVMIPEPDLWNHSRPTNNAGSSCGSNSGSSERSGHDVADHQRDRSFAEEMSSSASTALMSNVTSTTTNQRMNPGASGDQHCYKEELEMEQHKNGHHQQRVMIPANGQGTALQQNRPQQLMPNGQGGHGLPNGQSGHGFEAHFMQNSQTSMLSPNNNGQNSSDTDSIRQRQQRWTRRWYLLVIALLYIGLLASFSLNVSLLLRKGSMQQQQQLQNQGSTSPDLKESESYDVNRVLGSPASLSGDSNENSVMGASGSEPPGEGDGYAYTTSCLVKVPCESGNYWKCDVGLCMPCPVGFYQPQWGQTSCWACPANTTTDNQGAIQPVDCKRQTCSFYIKNGMGVLESPNFPNEYPYETECHWRIRPGKNKRVLVIISNIQLDSECQDSLVIRKSDHPSNGVVFETCDSHQDPVIFTGHSRNLWVDFKSAGNSSGTGFQMSFLTIEDELGYLVDAIVTEEKISSFDKRPLGDMSLEDKHLLARLLLVLKPGGLPLSGLTGNVNGLSGGSGGGRRKRPIINVIETSNNNDNKNTEINSSSSANGGVGIGTSSSSHFEDFNDVNENSDSLNDY